jgi:hypothetical protein
MERMKYQIAVLIVPPIHLSLAQDRIPNIISLPFCTRAIYLGTAGPYVGTCSSFRSSVVQGRGVYPFEHQNGADEGLFLVDSCLFWCS